jgi:hypothetical protein
MLGYRTALLAVLAALLTATSLLARGRAWNFLGYTKFDGNRNHGEMKIRRSDRAFRTLQLRFSGDAIFFDRLLIHFGNGTSQELVVSGRISSDAMEYVVEFPSNGKGLESVEFWYFKEHWDHNPSMSLYGSSLPVAESAGEPQVSGH